MLAKVVVVIRKGMAKLPGAEEVGPGDELVTARQELAVCYVLAGAAAGALCTEASRLGEYRWQV